jgi:hypothetical protein
MRFSSFVGGESHHGQLFGNWDLVIGIWLLFGHWDLEFGHSPLGFPACP